MSVTYSLEVFPPRDARSSVSLWRAINIYEQLAPAYISITCHSSGTSFGLTRELVEALCARPSAVEFVPHMVCYGQSKDTLASLLDAYHACGVRSLIALRGDKLPGMDAGDFTYASDLVTFIKQRQGFGVVVAGYPEGHPESPDADSDLAGLKAKIDAGANAIITQFFFDPDVFLRYRDKVAQMGISVPVIPGVLPIVRFDRLVNFAKKCQASVPDFLHRMFAHDNLDATSEKLLAMNVLTHQITKLHMHGIEHFHFYTLNELTLTSQTCHWMRTAL